MPDILIRPCTRQDIESVFQLDKLWEAEDVSYVFTPIPLADLIAGFEQFPQYFLVAEHDSQIIGYVNGSLLLNRKLNPLPLQTPCLEIENIYVRPEFRGSHVGSDLLDRLLAVAAQNGITRFLVSTVTKDMDRILAFYRRHGFQPWYIELFK